MEHAQNITKNLGDLFYCEQFRRWLNTNRNRETCKECDLRNAVTSVMKENKIMKMISRRDFLKASAVVGAAGVLTACGGSSASTAASSTAASTAASSTAAASGSANIGVCIYQFADNFMTL